MSQRGYSFPRKVPSCPSLRNWPARSLGGETMSDDRLHVVFGTGQVGLALAARLDGLGIAVRTVSRHRPAAPAAGVDWRAADATDPEAAAAAARGASVVYQYLNAPS